MKTKAQTFNEFLVAQHAMQYQGIGDNMPDDYNDWRQALDVEDVILMAERWGKINEKIAVNNFNYWLGKDGFNQLIVDDYLKGIIYENN